MWTFRAISLLRNLTLDGKSCLRDDKKYAFVELHYPLPGRASLENVIMSRPVARGGSGVLENPPFYELPFLDNTIVTSQEIGASRQCGDMSYVHREYGVPACATRHSRYETEPSRLQP